VSSSVDTQQRPRPMSAGEGSVQVDGRAGSGTLPVNQTTARRRGKSSN